LIDKFGSRKLMVLGIILCSVALFLLSYMQNIFHFYLFMLLMALGGSTAGGQVTLVSTVSWFEQKRARALALATAGGTLGGLLVVVVAVLVESMGWREALRVMALVLLLWGLLAGSNVRTRPLNHHQGMDGIPLPADSNYEDARRWGAPLNAVLRTRTFWLLAIAQLTMFFAITAIVVHHIPYMENSVGISKTAAAVGSAIFAIASLVGRLIAGEAADRFDKRIVLAVVVMLSVIAMPAFAFVQNLWQSALVLSVIACGTGGANPIRTALLADYFGTRSFGVINGAATTVGTLGAFLGPWLVGLTVDITDGYTFGFVFTGVIALFAIPAVLASKPPVQLIADYGPGGRG
jgi:sugar phosphate permease